MKRFPLKVMRVITWLPWGGIEKRMVEVLRRLDREKFLPVVCCLRKKKGVYEDELREAGIRVIKLNFQSRLDPRGILSLTNLIKKERVDILHSHMYRANIPSLIAGNIVRVRVKLVQVHNLEDWKRWREWWMERLLFPSADRIIGVSRAVLEYERKHLRIPEDKGVVLYNGIDTESYPYPPDEELKKSLGIPPEAKVVGEVARLHPTKGQDVLIRCARKVLEKSPQVYFLLVGGGDYGKELKRMVKEIGLDKRFIFTGAVRDPRPYYSIMDISVLPSLQEGFSNTILESLAQGLPVIASRVGGNPEVIEEGREGFLVPYGEEDELAERIITLLRNESLRRKMGERAREKAEKFSLTKMVENTENLYLSLYEEKLTSFRRGEEVGEGFRV